MNTELARPTPRLNSARCRPTSGAGSRPACLTGMSDPESSRNSGPTSARPKTPAVRWMRCWLTRSFWQPATRTGVGSSWRASARRCLNSSAAHRSQSPCRSRPTSRRSSVFGASNSTEQPCPLLTHLALICQREPTSANRCLIDRTPRSHVISRIASLHSPMHLANIPCRHSTGPMLVPPPTPTGLQAD